MAAAADAGILLAAAALAGHETTPGRAITAALLFLDRYPDAELALEVTVHRPPGGLSVALVLSARCDTAGQVAQTIRVAADLRLAA
jgi:hypothetical protein